MTAINTWRLTHFRSATIDRALDSGRGFVRGERGTR